MAVCRLAPDAAPPEWSLGGSFFSVIRTADELSVVCEEFRVPSGVHAERGWRALKLQGPFPFSMTGVLASFLTPLSGAAISIFAISTFDTDYVLIKNEDVDRAVAVLARAGHELVSHER